jgi:sensor histidine kinase YesM
MKNIITQIKQHRFFLLFVFLFAYAQSIQIRILVEGTLNWYIFTPEAAAGKFIFSILLIAVISFFLKQWNKSVVFSTKEALKVFATSLLVYLLLIKTIEFFIALLFNTVARNFNSETFILSTFSELMDGLIYGSFFLAYYYYIKSKSQLKQLVTYNQALSFSKINQLKAQLNPHFLFNNLNVLDQLIEEDKHNASNFLNEFADIYRYVLQVSDKHLIPINDELAFAKKYFNLIKHKYGNAYLLEMNILNTEGNIVPLTLQLLIENVVKHNIGTESKPVRIKISLNKSLTISNNIVPKRQAKISTAIALNNLKEQYALLSKQQIDIQKTDENFSVTIPIIPIQQL